MPNKYVDCDGHVMEKVDEMISYVGEPFKTTGHMNPRRMLPSLDRFHTPRLEERKPGTFRSQRRSGKVAAVSRKDRARIERALSDRGIGLRSSRFSSLGNCVRQSV